MECQPKPRGTSLLIHWTNHWSNLYLASILYVVVIQRAALVGKVNMYSINSNAFHSTDPKGYFN